MSENRLLKISTLENKIQVLDAECASLVQELNKFKKLSCNIAPAPVTQYSSSTDKINYSKVCLEAVNMFTQNVGKTIKWENQAILLFVGMSGKQVFEISHE